MIGKSYGNLGLSSLSGGRRLLEDGSRKLMEPVSPSGQPDEKNVDTRLMIILAAMLCSLICVVGLFSMVRCTMRCRLGRMGSPQVANSGMKKKALRALPSINYGKDPRLPDSATDCPICLGEFVEGETVRVLPKCKHCFHLQCIDTWFKSHSSCPTCRHSLLYVKERKPKVMEPCRSQAGHDNSQRGGRSPAHSSAYRESFRSPDDTEWAHP
eukprot:Gb_20666 [translate_table: standard]